MKTFSKEKYIEVEGMEEYQEIEIIRQLLDIDVNWIDECDGKTTSYLRKRGYHYKEEWLVSDGSELDSLEEKFEKAMGLTITELNKLQEEAGLNIIEKLMFMKHTKNCFELLRTNLFEVTEK